MTDTRFRDAVLVASTLVAEKDAKCDRLKADLDASRASGETLQQELNDCRVIADERLGDFTEQMALVRAAEAEVARLTAALQKAQQWQPIASAPKSETQKVDLWARAWSPASGFVSERFTNCYWRTDDSFGGWKAGWVNLPSDREPTHWMPLPLPPLPLSAGEAEHGK